MITAVLIFQIELDIANLVDFVYDVVARASRWLRDKLSNLS